MAKKTQKSSIQQGTGQDWYEDNLDRWKVLFMCSDNGRKLPLHIHRVITFSHAK